MVKLSAILHSGMTQLFWNCCNNCKLQLKFSCSVIELNFLFVDLGNFICYMFPSSYYAVHTLQNFRMWGQNYCLRETLAKFPYLIPIYKTHSSLSVWALHWTQILKLFSRSVVLLCFARQTKLKLYNLVNGIFFIFTLVLCM